MTALYWVTFRIASIGNYDARYQRLDNALSAITDDSKWWIESTSFYLFRAELDIDGVASVVAGALDLSHDLALVGMPEVKAARAIGATEDPDLFRLLPFAKKF